MDTYSVGRLARLAGVSVRTLHYYDEIELLQPSGRSASGYRSYDKNDLLRLQQIRFYRELDLPLDEIKTIVRQPDFDPLAALQTHRVGLEARSKRLRNLIATVDLTIEKLMEENMSMSDEDLFAAFTPDQAERYQKEARDLYGEARVTETEHKLKKMSKEQWKTVQEEGGLVSQVIAALIDRAPDDPQVQDAIARHHAWIENFYPAPAEVYRGLGQMYAEHPEFRSFYEQYTEGLADFMKLAMEVYAQTELA